MMTKTEIKITREIVRRLAAGERCATITAAREIVRAAVGRGVAIADREAVERRTLAECLRISRMRERRHAARETIDLPLCERLRARRERWAGRLAADIEHAICYHPARGGVAVRFGGDGRGQEVTARVVETDGGRYSSRCTYHMMTYDLIVTADPRSSVEVRDGVAMIVAPGGVRRLGRVEVLRGWIIQRGRGYSSVAVRAAVCVTDARTGASYHGDDVAECVAGIRRKIAARAAAEKRRNAPLAADTVLTAAAYQRITGACDAGTDAWLEAHGLTRRDRMTAGALLAMLDDRDYGRDKLAAAIGM